LATTAQGNAQNHEPSSVQDPARCGERTQRAALGRYGWIPRRRCDDLANGLWTRTASRAPFERSAGFRDRVRFWPFAAVRRRPPPLARVRRRPPT